MEVAIVGLVGVIVGGLITGGFQVFVEWRKQRRSGQHAKRLVCGELLNASLLLRTTATRPSKTWPYLLEVASVLPISAWQEHRAHLSDVVDEDLWNRLVLIYAGIGLEQGRLAFGKDLPPDTPLTEPVTEQMQGFVIELERIRRALGCRGDPGNPSPPT